TAVPTRRSHRCKRLRWSRRHPARDQKSPPSTDRKQGSLALGKVPPSLRTDADNRPRQPRREESARKKRDIALNVRMVFCPLPVVFLRSHEFGKAGVSNRMQFEKK